MGRGKSNAKLDREVRRESRRVLRNKQKLTDVESAQLIRFDGRNRPEDIAQIGMEKEKRDRTPIEARNVNQGLFIDSLEKHELIIATGPAGVGKSFLATAFAVDQLIEKNYEKIYVTRPMVSADEDMGFLKGSMFEKWLPYFRPIYDTMRRRMGASFLQYCLREEIEKIEIVPFAFMRGRDLRDAIVILDEAQNVTVNQMKLFLTRAGENSKIIIDGDVNQCDLPRGVKSGLVDLLERIEAKGIDVPVINFTEADCVRSKICATALEIYSE